MSGNVDGVAFFGVLVVFLLTPLVTFSLSPEYAAETSVVLWSAELAIGVFLFLSFGNNRSLTQELASVTYQPNGDSSLENSVEEARKTLDAQVDNLNDIDTKAIRILRINVLLIGLLLSALTFSAKTQTVPFDKFLNVYFGVGVLLLILSTATAGLTYTASDFRAGISKSNIVTVLQEDLTAEELHLVLSKSYAKWIHDNQSAELLNSFFSTSTILLLIYAIAYLALGVYHALIDPVSLLLEGGSNVSLLVITLVSGYPSQLKQVLNEANIQIG